MPLANAELTLSKDLPLPAEISSASCCSFRAWLESFVLLSNLSKLGRNSSSVTPVNNEVLRICFSTSAICAVVAPVTFVKAVASFT